MARMAPTEYFYLQAHLIGSKTSSFAHINKRKIEQPAKKFHMNHPKP